MAFASLSSSVANPPENHKLQPELCEGPSFASLQVGNKRTFAFHHLGLSVPVSVLTLNAILPSCADTRCIQPRPDPPGPKAPQRLQEPPSTSVSEEATSTKLIIILRLCYFLTIFKPNQLTSHQQWTKWSLWAGDQQHRSAKNRQCDNHNTWL